MDRHRTHYTLFHLFLQLPSEDHGRRMQPEAALIRAQVEEEILLMASWEAVWPNAVTGDQKILLFLSSAERR